MGRWAQRRMRSTNVTPAEPVAPVNLVDITCDGSSIAIATFDAVVTTPGGGPDAALDISGDSQGPFGGQTGTSINLLAGGGGGHTSGEPWTLSSQPAWLTTPVNFPASGLTS